MYEYKGAFVGMYKNDVLLPTSLQKRNFKVEKVSDIFPKYHILKVNNFNDVAKEPLDDYTVRLEAKVEVARNLIALGLDKETIAQGTGLSLEEVEELKAK